MEVKNSLNKLVDPYSTKATPTERQDSNAQRQQVGAVQKGDQVNVSQTAKLTATTYAAAMAAPEIRKDKVEALKARIASGAYEIDSKRIAENLLREATELRKTLE